VDHGFSNKMAGKMIHGYGNAIVPELAYRIFKSISEVNASLSEA